MSSLKQLLDSRIFPVTVMSSSETKTAKPKRAIKSWKLEQSFKCRDDVKSFLETVKIWSKTKTHATKLGPKEFYRCNQVIKRGPSCTSEMYLLYHQDTKYVDMFITSATHDHSMCLLPTISSSQRDLINNLRVRNRPTSDIKIELESCGMPIDKIQLSNFLSREKRKREEQSEMTVGQFNEWCLFHSNSPLDDDNKPFVLAFNIKDAFEDNPNVRAVISTKNLLLSAAKGDGLYVQVIYDLNSQDLPMIVIGIFNERTQFLPIALAVLTTMTQDDYEFVFKVYKDHVPENKIRFLISNASENAIRDAFKETFGPESILLTSYSQVRMEIEEQLKGFDKPLKNQIMHDVELLHVCRSPEIFEKVTKLFVKKWRLKESEFVDYMQDKWLSTHLNWYQGYGNHQVTIDSLKAFNKIIKDQVMRNKNQHMTQFLSNLMDNLRNWSLEYDYKEQHKKPEIDNHLWTLAAQWSKLNVHVKLKSTDDYNEFLIPADDKPFSNPDLITTYNLWNTIEEYEDQMRQIYILQLPTDSSKWKKGTCTCPYYLKNYLCKHLVGKAIQCKYIKPPVSASTVIIGIKKGGKRGRPKKVISQF